MLNAFRHQRGSHTPPASSSYDGSECSTPFGIKEDRTWPLGVVWWSRYCAQRLSASKRIARYSRRMGHQRYYVLNAFRHQRGSHFHEPGNIDLDHMCSTPFGIKEDRTLEREVVLFDRVQCSTPFGIKEDRTREFSDHQEAGRWVLNAFRHQRGSHTGFLIPSLFTS